MIDAFCVQLKSAVLENELAEQVVKNLVFSVKILNRFESEFDSIGDETHLGHDLNLEWLVKKVIKEANYELVNKPKETIKVIINSERFFFSNSKYSY